MAYPHGIRNTEKPTSLTAPIRGTAALQVVIGTAPVHLAADPYKAANAPKLCYSFGACQTELGYSTDFKAYTLCASMSACFQVFNVAPIILINVLDPTKHVKENPEETCSVVDGMARYACEGVLLDTVSVKSNETVLTPGTDYEAEHDDDGLVVITLLSETALAASSLTVSSKSVDPTAVNKADIVGGVDVKTGAETGIELVRRIYPKFGMTPGILLAPGWSQDPVVCAALNAKTTGLNGNFDCCTYVDIAADDTGAAVYTDCREAKQAMGASGSHMAVFWPMAAVGERIYPMSAMAGAETAFSDIQNGDVPYDSPSNKDLRITATVLADGTEVVLDEQQANDMLNANGIITAINSEGFKLWGNSTAAYPGTSDPKDRWLAVRRFFDWDGNNFVRTCKQKVDRTGNKRLVQEIVDSQNIIGNGYVALNYCAGYRMEFRADENPAPNLLAGHLTVHTHLAPYIPAEFIENIREYDVAALTAALTGGD